MKIERTGPLDWEGLQFAAFVEGQLNNEAMKQFEELIKAWYLVGWYGGVGGKLHHRSDIEWGEEKGQLLIEWRVDMGSATEQTLDVLIRCLEQFEQDHAVRFHPLLLGRRFVG